MKTRIVMDSGKEYIVEGHPETIANSFSNGVTLINRFTPIELSDEYGTPVLINPTHVSALEPEIESREN